jgi:insertion element IS1 protein InsB
MSTFFLFLKYSKIRKQVLCVIKALIKMKCKKCNSEKITKNGKSRNGEQRYRCKLCLNSFQINFKYQSYVISDKQIIILTKEGCGVRSTSRILEIHPSTVLRRILKIASKITRPYPILKGQKYQVDELFTYIKNKKNRICIAYSFEPKSKKIINFIVGRRNKTNLKKITDTIILSKPEKISTDKLNIYKELIPQEIHNTKLRGINHIERNNLNLRTHIKRLNRRTICYSKNLRMLIAIVKIYFWA